MIHSVEKYIKKVKANNNYYNYFYIEDVARDLNFEAKSMPFCLKILFENLIRNYDQKKVSTADLMEFGTWLKNGGKSSREIQFTPSRVLMQDFTGVPAVVDLAAMRDIMKKMGGDPAKINPKTQVDLVIDHSVQVDSWGEKTSYKKNVEFEYSRNIERYKFLNWAQKAFDNFRVVPPGTGICHQTNLEYLASVVTIDKSKDVPFIYPDTVVGTDSHTTMINGLGVLGWGVGGIEAEAAMLGQPISMLIPEVVGFELKGDLPKGATATDLVLTITQILRQKNVVGKFVEFYGTGVARLSLADRATIANMAPEYGATCGFFPVDAETITYLRLTKRPEELISVVENYCKAQNMWADHSIENEKIYSSKISINLADVESCLAGPKRPQDRIVLKHVPKTFQDLLPEVKQFSKEKLDHGSIAIAAITSCTNTSNPYVLVAAGLLAKKACENGLTIKPWVKTSLAPGSQVVLGYLENSGLQNYFDKLGFNVVGFGCTTCIGNSGPLAKEIEEEIISKNLTVASVLSGNRNFEGRVHPLVKANYLASPPLVVAYAIAGSVDINITTEPLAKNEFGKDVYLADIWPSNQEIIEVVNKFVTSDLFEEKYKTVFQGDEFWQKISMERSLNYNWDENSTYIKNPPFFADFGNLKKNKIEDIMQAKILAIFGDSITTDHISPAGNISENSPAGKYLKELGVSKSEFNSYGARRGNHEIMMRGTFANIRIRNEITQEIEGGYTKLNDGSGEILSIYDAAMEYKKASTPVVIFAGKEYGTGSSRDWAAKGPKLLGVKAVIAESFERIHRTNLVGMGILPFVFNNGKNRKDLNLDGSELISIKGIEDELAPNKQCKLIIDKQDGQKIEMPIQLAVFTGNEVEYIKSGGILNYVLHNLS